MKKQLALLTLLILAGCAVDSTGLRPDQLIQREYLRTERNLPMTFPEIQMALFKHESVCGSAPVFRVKEGESSYATITESGSDDLPWNQTIIFDLMWLQPTLRYESRTRAYVYSFYSNAEVKQRIANIFNAILEPEICPGDGADHAAEDGNDER